MIREKLRIKTLRYWEVDTLRGVAIILMVFYHLVWDLDYFGVVQANMASVPWRWFARSTGATFIWLVGVSLVLSYTRANPSGLLTKYLRRGAKIFSLGLLITLVTYLVLGRGFVVFGILHLIGFSIAAAYALLPAKRRYLSLMAGVVFIAAGIYLNSQIWSSPWLIWLGLKQGGRLMVDYYPVLPWFGVALVGIYAGHTLYPGGMRRLAMANKSEDLAIQGLSFLGRHSLIIYVIHQPVLLGLLIVVGIGSV